MEKRTVKRTKSVFFFAQHRLKHKRRVAGGYIMHGYRYWMMLHRGSEDPDELTIATQPSGSRLQLQYLPVHLVDFGRRLRKTAGQNRGFPNDTKFPLIEQQLDTT